MEVGMNEAAMMVRLEEDDDEMMVMDGKMRMKRRASISEMTALTEMSGETTKFSSSATVVTNDTEEDENEGRPYARAVREYESDEEEDEEDATFDVFADEEEEDLIREVSNYDVLIVPASENKRNGAAAMSAMAIVAPPVQFISGNDHVGNNRFMVTLQMHRRAYADAILSGSRQEMEDIERQIVDTICNRVLPAGRFLEKAPAAHHNDDQSQCSSHYSTMAYRDLGAGRDARLVVRRALINPPPMPTATAPPAPSSTPSAPSTSSSESEYEDAEDEDRPKIEPANFRFSPSFLTKKRRRRSFTRRGSGNNAPSKCPNRRSSFENKSNTSNTSNKEGIARSAVGMYDVLLSSPDTRGVLSTDNIGNNRVRVMMEMRRARFAQVHASGDLTAACQIATDVVHSVHSGHKCSGKFLREDISTGLWVEVPVDVATDVILRCLIDPALANVEAPSYLDDGDVDADNTFEPTPLLPPMAPTSTLIPPDPTFNSDDVILYPKNRIGATARAAARGAPAPRGENVEALRSTAVETLMKRRQKKAVASNLKMNQIEEIQKHFAEKARN